MITTEEFLKAKAIVEQYYIELGELVHQNNPNDFRALELAIQDIPLIQHVKNKYHVQFSVRSINVLSRVYAPHNSDTVCIKTYGDLIEYVKKYGLKYLLHTRNLGRKTLSEIGDFLIGYFGENWYAEYNF